MPQLTAQLLADLLDRHGPALKLYVRQWCHAPDDVVQQSFIDLAACAQLPANPVAWLYIDARRRAVDAVRADRRRQRHEGAAAVQWFERSQEQHAAAESAANALADLPLAEREIVIAHFWGRLTFEEIAQMIGGSSSGAQRRFETAMNRLREKLNPDRINIPCPNQKA